MQLKNKNLNFDKIKFAKNFDEKGFVVLKNFFSKNFSFKLAKSLNFFLKKKHKLKNINFSKNNSKINSAHDIKQWKYIKILQRNPKIKNLAKVFLKGKIKNFGSEVFAKPAKVGLESPVHQDNYYWNIKNNKGITFWIALNRATKKNGSIFYYEKSHKLGLLKHIPSFAPGSSQKIKDLKKLKKFKIVSPSLNVGDIIIHNSLIAHGSKKNTSEHDRMGLTLRFIPSDSKINVLKKKKISS